MQLGNVMGREKKSTMLFRARDILRGIARYPANFRAYRAPQSIMSWQLFDFAIAAAEFRSRINIFIDYGRTADTRYCGLY